MILATLAIITYCENTDTQLFSTKEMSRHLNLEYTNLRAFLLSISVP